jgi:hypothetical protein
VTTTETDTTHPRTISRPAVGSETYCRASIHLAREAHLRTIYRDFRFSEFKARAIFDKATVAPERVGLISMPRRGRTIAEGQLYQY